MFRILLNADTGRSPGLRDTRLTDKLNRVILGAKRVILSPYDSWRSLMLLNIRLPLLSVVVFCIALSFTEIVLSADKEVAFPQPPKGAGQIDEDAPKTFTESKSGLKYRILRKGDGAKPKASNKVEVNYHGWLDSGKVFDSSYKRGESISFGLNQVIAGWTEGMQYVGEGGMIELEIPSKLGYGQGGTQGIPGGSTLHFLVELIKVQ